MSDRDTETNPQKKLGVTMSLLAWGILLILLVLAFDEWLAQRSNPNRQAEAETLQGNKQLVLYRNHQNHYLANGTINHYPVTFILDTGATDVVIPAQLAEKIGLKRGAPSTAVTANGRVTVYATRLAEVDIGGIQLNEVTASINPGMEEPLVLLGMSALHQVEFTQRGDTLVLRR